MSSTFAFILNCGYTFWSSFIASDMTILNSKTDHCDPGTIAVVVCSGSATHISDCTFLWCSKYRHKTLYTCCGNSTSMAHLWTTRHLTFFTCRCQMHHKCDRVSTNSLGSCRALPSPATLPKLLRVARQCSFLEQLFFSCLPLLHHWLSQSLPPSNKRGQQCNWLFIGDVLWTREEHRGATLFWPVPTLIHVRESVNCASFSHEILGLKPITSHAVEDLSLLAA